MPSGRMAQKKTIKHCDFICYVVSFFSILVDERRERNFEM